MKELCNKLMKLNPDLPYGTDFSTIALALFLRDERMAGEKLYSIVDYSHYLFRFYSDIAVAKENHYYKLINEIWHYQPSDIYEYSKSVLKYVEENVGLIRVHNTFFSLVDCPGDIDKYDKIIQGVIQALVVKYIGNDFKAYNAEITDEEFKGKKLFAKESRVFNRALEITNYCFITDEMDLSCLCAVELLSKDVFEPNNYLIMSKEYADMYIKGILQIKKNGYPYVNGKRMYQHLEIRVLKQVRNNLTDIYEESI